MKKEIIKNNGSKNLGWRTDRLNFDPEDLENVFSKHWAKENDKIQGINYGYGILQDLFCSREKFTISMFLKIKNRDRLITATVIQWLGTNVGFCWLREALNNAGYDIVKRKLKY